MKTKRKIPRKKQKNLAKKVPPFPVEFRIKVARLNVEDGYPATLIAEQFGISEYSVYRWGRTIRDDVSCVQMIRRVRPALPSNR